MRTFIKSAIPVFRYLVAVGDFFQNPTLGDFVAVLVHLGSASIAIKDWIERLAAHRRKKRQQRKRCSNSRGFTTRRVRRKTPQREAGRKNDIYPRIPVYLRYGGILMSVIIVLLSVLGYLSAVVDFVQDPTLAGGAVVLIKLMLASADIKNWIEKLASRRRKQRQRKRRRKHTRKH